MLNTNQEAHQDLTPTARRSSAGLLRVGLICAVLCCGRLAPADDFVWTDPGGFNTWDDQLGIGFPWLDLTGPPITPWPNGPTDTALFSLPFTPPIPADVLVDFSPVVQQLTVQSQFLEFDFGDFNTGGPTALTVLGSNLFTIGGIPGPNPPPILIIDSTLSGSPGGINANGTLIGDGNLSVGGFTINGPGAFLNDTNQIKVGSSGNGSLAVSGGATASTTGALYLGLNASGVGQVIVDGLGSSLQAATMGIGNSGQGTLYVSGGATASTTGALNLGLNASGVGEVNVSGLGSSLHAATMGIGNSGQGTLNVSAGGLVSTPGSFSIGGNSGGVGIVNVDGIGSSLQSTFPFGPMLVGDTGQGTLTITNGATVFFGPQAIVIGRNSGGLGSVTMSGSNSSMQSGQLIVGESPGNVFSSGTGFLTVNGGTASATVIELGLGFGSQGTITLNGAGSSLHSSGLLDVGVNGVGTLIVNTLSSVTVGNAVLIAGGSTVDLSGGGLMSVGNVGLATPDPGSMLIGAGGGVRGAGTIIGLVVNNGGTLTPEFFPGALHITGTYTQGAGGTLHMQLGGASPGSGYDQLFVSGDMLLAGLVKVDLINGFLPTLGETFDVFSIGGSFSDPTATFSFPALPAGEHFTTAFSGGIFSLTVVPEPSSLALAAGAALGLCAFGLRRTQRARRKTRRAD
jgi:T5SS/PEP-CTERM-associated repeat protein